MKFTVAAKCAPERTLLRACGRAGLKAVELYLTAAMLKDVPALVRVCRPYAFRYAVHAPNDGYLPVPLADLAHAVGARVCVFHNMFWEDQWEAIDRAFKGSGCLPCVENIASIHESLKFMMRFGWGRCLDLEHLQIECAGFYEEEFIKVIRQSSHIHLTGYRFGSQRWHSHLHHDPLHAAYVLDVIRRSGFSGFVVSEAQQRFQTYEEFKRLNAFVTAWKRGGAR